MTTTYTVEFIHQGKTHTLEVPEDKTILSVAEEAGLELPSSCNAGVCTTCAGKIVNGGSVDQSEGMGVSPRVTESRFCAALCFLSSFRFED